MDGQTSRGSPFQLYQLRWISQRLKELRLTSDAGDLVGLYEQILQYGLHSEDLLCLIMLNKVYFAIGAPADRLQDSEIALLHGRFIG